MTSTDSTPEDHMEVEIYTKFDYELTKKEINQIFVVYNECFYYNKVTKSSHVKLAKKWIASSHIFQWYLAKKDDQIIGIANLVYDFKNCQNFSLNVDKGENISSVGVLEKYRRLGIARLLMKKIIEEQQPIRDLVVEIKSRDPMFRILTSFYESLGFEEMDEFVTEEEEKREKEQQTDQNKKEDDELGLSSQSDYYFILKQRKKDS